MVLGSSVTKLGTYLLYGMDATTDVTVNEGLTAISDSAFGNMTALTWIRFKGNAPTFASNCFYNVTATAYYHSGKSGWTSSVMQDYRGHITWQDMDAGYIVTVTSYCGENATVNLNSGGSYQGEISFTVLSVRDQAVLVTVKNGNNYTVLPCTADGKRHVFTLNVTKNTEIVVAFKGDVNLDGSLDLKDSLRVKKYVAGDAGQIGDQIQLLAGDVNADGSVNLKDLLAIKKAIAGSPFAW